MLCMVLKTEIKFWHSLSFQEIFLWQIYIKNKPNGAKTEIWFDTICWYMYHQFHRNAILYQKRFPQVYFIVCYTKFYKLCISTYFDTVLLHNYFWYIQRLIRYFILCSTVVCIHCIWKDGNWFLDVIFLKIKIKKTILHRYLLWFLDQK